MSLLCAVQDKLEASKPLPNPLLHCLLIQPAGNKYAVLVFACKDLCTMCFVSCPSAVLTALGIGLKVNTAWASAYVAGYKGRCSFAPCSKPNTDSAWPSQRGGGSRRRRAKKRLERPLKGHQALQRCLGRAGANLGSQQSICRENKLPLPS
jgi:hypothetical protein